MSSTFPTIPGYGGPWSLKDFLLRYFFVQLRFEASSPACFASCTYERILFVPPTGGFAVVVYVSLGAPPPPPLSGRSVTSGVGELLTAGQDFLPRMALQIPHGRPLTSSLLRCLFWDSLFSQLGPAVVSFITLWCPLVVQFEPSGGGLQALGPPLKNAVPRAAKRQRSLGCMGFRKRGCYEKNTQPRTTQAASFSSVALSLYRLNVSRLPLIGEVPLRTFAEIDRGMDPRLAELWQEHHGDVDSTAPCRCSVIVGGDPMPCSEACRVWTTSKELVHLVFPYTFAVNGNSDNTVRMESVERHLTHVLHCLLGGVCRMNFRGAAIKHAGFLEERSLPFNRCRSHAQAAAAAAAVPVSELTLPESIVTSYLRSLLEGLWWRAPQDKERVSFWGEPLVLERLCSITLSWLQCGRQETFSLSHFLHEVPVAKLPWLRGFYTRDVGRKRRSMIQQRVFLQLIFFLFQHVVPFLVRRSFHVTWSSKKPNAFLFIPKLVWCRLVDYELRQVCLSRRSREKRERNAAGTNQSMALERVTADNLLASKLSSEKNTAYAAPPVLYSSIRFLVDQRKLRPIAQTRLVNVRRLLKMADGLSVPRGAATRTQPKRAAAPKIRSARSSSASPHVTLLRGALRCLLVGVAEHRVGSSLAKFTNISHQDEYAEIRSFVEGARHFCRRPQLVSTPMSSSAPPSGSPMVAMLRGDAARCYDYLPQEVVMHAVERLVNHDSYYTVSLTAIAPWISSGAGTGTLESVHGQRLKAGGVGTTNAEILLHQCVRSQTVSGECVQNGTFPGIPMGWIMYEEPASASDSWLRGDETRAILKQHLQQHLVLIDGKLYLQRVGIAQGSAVAMLLCDTIFETVDQSLSSILSQHEEPALLLRRVDDVLVVTMSHVAASCCAAALRRGWPEVGFVCQGEKLRCTTDALIPWCGLLWNPQTLEFSVEWRRLASLLPHIASYPMTGNEPLHCSLRLMSILCLRTPLTVLCRRINSKTRVLQTLCEIGFLWSRFFLKKLVQNAAFMRPYVRVLLRPLALAIASLRRLLKRHKGHLERLGSFCDITDEEIRLCVLFTLHKTLQGWLPWMISRLQQNGDGLKRFFILLLAIVRRKMRAELFVEGALCEKGDEHGFARRGSNHGTVVAAAAVGEDNAAHEVVGALLLAEGEDTVIARALAAVQFSAFHAH
ncbi:telomerase reverse transcriptase [Trypanosoma rangeli SC58]|uniref:Telomerase reverse transcriptase n=1 Tax=Trypanosoma rangeli SC58 TaxID=429131 RepID=A0A061J1L3_TRYRA|nr:telomerase reverse transcriptase [Trypanosoma rangeli SC58]